MQFTIATATAALLALTSTVIAGPIEARDTGAYMINIVNKCSETIFPGVGQTPSSPEYVLAEFGGFELVSGASKMIYVPGQWVAGRVFARQGCTVNGGTVSCAVGDCGGMSCSMNSGVPGVSLVEFSASGMDMTFYNLSLISGYNLPVQVTPSDPSCPTFTCTSENCPSTQAYQPNASTNPCYGCSRSSGYTVTFCPS